MERINQSSSSQKMLRSWKKRNIIILLMAACLLPACTNKAAELNEEQLQEIIKCIPDHGIEDIPSDAFTEEYYSALDEAWSIPDGGLGEIGNNEFLFYFVCGNDPCESHRGKLGEVTMKGDTTIVHFDIVHEEDRGTDPHTLKLVMNNGQWLIADYDNTLAEMKEYVTTQREYLRSEEFTSAAQEMLNDPEVDEEWKNGIREELQSVQDYFNNR